MPAEYLSVIALARRKIHRVAVLWPRLAGWALDIAPLKSVVPDAATMKANTALAFIGLGLAVAVAVLQHRQPRFRAIRLMFALAVTLLGLLTLAEYRFGWNLGIDQLLFT